LCVILQLKSPELINWGSFGRSNVEYKYYSSIVVAAGYGLLFQYRKEVARDPSLFGPPTDFVCQT